MPRIGEGIIDLKTHLANFKKGIGEAKTSLSKFSGFVDKNAQQIRDAGLVVTAFGAAVVGSMAMAVKSSAAFQKEMANVNTMLDDQSTKWLPKLSNQVKNMSMKYGEATSTLSQGLYDILSAGIPVAKAMDVLEASTIAAKAGMSTTGVAADALTTILNSYGLAAEEAGDVSDWFFAIIKRGKTTFAELGPQIGQVASLAASAGLNMDEFGAAIATMTKSGVKTDIAITSLKSILTGFLKPSKEAAKAARELGVELNTNTLKTQGLVPVLEKLEKATDAQVATMFGNARALTGLATILKDTSVYYEDLEFIQNRLGAAQEAFAKQTQTLSFQADILAKSIKILFINIGKSLLPAVTKVTKEIISLVQGIVKWTDRNKSLTKLVLKLTVAVGALASAIGPLLISLPFLVKQFKFLYPAIRKVFVLIAAHPVMAFVTALGLATIAVANLTDAYIDDRNAAINMGKTTKDLINLHKEEIETIKQRMRDTSLSLDEQKSLQEKYFATLKALKFQEKKLFEETEAAKTAAAKKTSTAQMIEDGKVFNFKKDLSQKTKDESLALAKAQIKHAKQIEAKWSWLTSSFESSFSQNFTDVILEGKDAWAALQNIASSVVRAIVNEITTAMAKTVVKQFLGLVGGGGGGGIISSGVGGLVSGAASGAGAQVGAGTVGAGGKAGAAGAAGGIGGVAIAGGLGIGLIVDALAHKEDPSKTLIGKIAQGLFPGQTSLQKEAEAGYQLNKEIAAGLHPELSEKLSYEEARARGIVGFGGIGGFDNGGIVPGPIGVPRLVAAHGGETFIPTHKPGFEGAGINITINANGPTNRAFAKQLGQEIYNEVRQNRKM